MIEIQSCLGESTGPVLVTGASGFVGRAAVQYLLDSGLVVRALARRGAESKVPEGAIVYPIRDLADIAGIRDAAAGCASIVHLAARVHVLRERSTDPIEAFREVNVVGTGSMLDAAREAGVARFVYLSSIAAADPVLSPYGRSKKEAEDLIQQRVQQGGMTAVILRPPGVYGPGMRGNIPRLLSRIRKGAPIPVPANGNKRSLIYVGNLTAAIGCALQAHVTGAPIIAVADPTPIPTADLVRTFAGALGVEPKLVHVPNHLAIFAGRIGDRINEFVSFPLTSTAIDRLFGSLVIDNSSARRQLRFVPPYLTRDALIMTARAWLPPQ